MSGGLRILDRPATGHHLRFAVPGGSPPKSHMGRIEFAASHRPSRNTPAMDPVRGSDRTSPSKSGRRGRQLPLRMPYATPFLLTNAHSPWHLQSPLGPLVLCQRPAARLCLLEALQSASRLPFPGPLLIGRSHSRVLPQASRAPTIVLQPSPNLAPALPDHLCSPAQL